MALVTQAQYDQAQHYAAAGTAPVKTSSSTVCIGDAEIPLFDLAVIINSVGQERIGQVRAFGDALRDVGFIAIKATEISPLLEKVVEQIDLYFSQTHEKKMEDDHHNNYQTGFWPQGFETAAGSKQPDNKETYFIPPNYQRWPTFSNPEEQKVFTKVMEEYQGFLTKYAADCMGIIAQYLGESTEEVTESMKSAENLLRLAHYPATKSDAPRAGAHYDLNCVTLLPPATGPGLQLLDKEGKWRSVSVPKGYLIVNTGEQLERKTAGKIQATLHQVVKPEGEEAARRLASIFFASWSTEFSLKPFEKCLIEMTKDMTPDQKATYLKNYPDVSVLENLLSRLIEMGSIADPAEGLIRSLRAKGLLLQPPEFIKEKYPDIFS